MRDLLITVFVGLLGAGVTEALLAVRRWWRDRGLERRYPIAGRYRSEFEDLEGGLLVRTKATCEFRQHGLRLVGKTWALADGRSWTLEGKIVPGGRIYGTYEAEDPNDPGQGGFFLESSGDGVLDGAWAGFDSKNKNITSGRYRFWRSATTPVVEMRAQDEDVVLSLLGEALGERYITRDELRTYARGDDGHFALVARSGDGTVQGAITACIGSHDDFLATVPTDMRSSVIGALPGLEYQRTGVVKSVAVSSRAQGRGVGTAMIEEAVHRLWKLGATCVVTVGWTDDTGCHIEGAVVALGFTKVATLPLYWNKDSIEHGYRCPTCGNPCRCEAHLFYLRRGDAGAGTTDAAARTSARN